MVLVVSIVSLVSLLPVVSSVAQDINIYCLHVDLAVVLALIASA